MNYLTIKSIILAFTASFFLSNNFYAQCNINGCAGNALLTSGSPSFDLAGSLIVPNVNFGNITCSEPTFSAGVDMYIYQILPDGTRAQLCNVVGPFPDNSIGITSAFFGQVDVCGQNFNLGTLSASLANGFQPCNGSVYEVELALFITESSFVQGSNTVYSQLPSTQYTTLNLGTIEFNTGGMPTGATPLTTAEISEYYTGNQGVVNVPCFTDVDLYIEGVSILGDCIPYGDYSSSVPSELVNELSYSINGGTSVVIQNLSTGAFGGQLTGANTTLGGACYSGILTSAAPYTFLASNLPDACSGNSVTVTISTTDLYTSQTVSSTITLVYGTSSSCPAILTENGNPIPAATYEASNQINSAGFVSSNNTVIFDAGNLIYLGPGFEVDQNVTLFEAKIQPCY